MRRPVSSPLTPRVARDLDRAAQVARACRTDLGQALPVAGSTDG
jgi:hypothetical protein